MRAKEAVSLISVATIILSWGNAHDTIRCAESVVAAYEFVGVGPRITIVDNGSCAETVATLSAWAKKASSTQIELVLSEQNKGFSAGMNRGIVHSQRRQQSDYLWLLNNDLYVSVDSLGELLAEAKRRRNVALFGPTVVSQQSKRVECAGGCRYYPLVGYSRPNYGGRAVDELDRLAAPVMDYVYGAAIFCRRDFIERIGGLDERYFLYYEELELAQRLTGDMAMGWCRKSIVYHAGGGSSVLAGVANIKVRQAALGAFKYTWRYYPYYLPTVFLARFLGILLRGLASLDPRPAVAVVAALVEFIGTDEK
jgi:GT2 family glycosyltransferase